MSFYEDAWIPLKIVPLARTININNIYVGTDKFGHFSHMGLRNYKEYLKFLNEGLAQEEATEKAIRIGFKTEYSFLGYGIDGVLSYGDLEANYQGLRYMISICDGEKPYFIFENGKWSLNPNHVFDVKEYFTPKMDEAYNLSFWRGPLYKKIQPKLERTYCQMKKDPIYQARIEYYHSIDNENINDKLIKEYIANQDRFLRVKEDIENTCSSETLLN
jgi:hypothetical protein